MEKFILTFLIIITTLIFFVIEQVRYSKLIERSNNEVKKSEVYCRLIMFKAKYDLLPDKKRLNKHVRVKQILDNIYDLEEILSIHMNFSEINFKCKNKITLGTLENSMDLLINVEKADEDIKELFKEALFINEGVMKLYSNKLYSWTYYTTKIQVNCIFVYIRLVLFVAKHIPSVKIRRDRNIKREYLTKDEKIVDSVMCTKFC